MHYHLKNLEIEASIGVYESEKISRQKILVSVAFDLNTSKAGMTDELEDTIDYSQLEQLVRKICQAEHYQLLEKLHAVLSEGISEKFSRLENVKISIEKFPFKNGSIVIF